ncbi:unnamed protein product [Hermetia illucens]|uniref:Reverse transcriptase/retrotransposon-derived protein RNase H-like domain-containing protein n=1 Tax=Hermetia illucens TaxID=343691 RepID=A0A7R8UAA1_HERIL|nr:unnamed protein product [Hermetia illucens]
MYAPLNKYLSDVKKRDKAHIELITEAREAFENSENSRNSLAEERLPRCSLSLVTNISDLAIGSVLQLKQHGHWPEHAYFQSRLSQTEAVSSAYHDDL